MRCLFGNTGTDNLHPWPERRCPFAFVAAAKENPRLLLLRIERQFMRSARFTNARLTDQEHELPMARHGPLQASSQHGHFLLTPNKDVACELLHRVDSPVSAPGIPASI